MDVGKVVRLVLQALAGVRLPHNLRHGAARYAAAESGVVAIAA